MALVTVQRSPSPSNTAESEDVDIEEGSTLKSPNRSRSFSESYFTVKGAALILPQNDIESNYTKKISKSSNGDIQSHLECMITLLRRQDTIAVAVKLEVNGLDRHKYMAVVSCMGKQDTEESVILGIDFSAENQATIGLVLPIWADAQIELDGDGGFSIKSGGSRHMFKPVTVQVMWFTLQSLNKLVRIARENKYICGGLSHTWVSYYETSVTSDMPRISEWHTTEDLMFFKAEPVLLATDDEEESFLKRVQVELKNVMMKEDLDEATSKHLRTKLEEQMNMKLDKWKSYIDKEMMTILGQMDSPTKIKDYLYLGSEWNASNIEELTNNGVAYIMNISREIDNFFPGVLHYYNIREWDCEETDLLKYWERTHDFISKIREKKAKILVHCKMGISRSASTVLAYLMKEYNMTRQEAYDSVKVKRSCIMPNKAFWTQLETYEGILSASNKRHVFKQRSETNMAQTMKELEQIEEDRSFLGMSPEHIWNKDLDESYSDVFLKDHSDSCSNEFDNEIASSSRSADSNEEYYPDLPSPTPEGATGGVPGMEEDSGTSSSSEEDEEDIDITENLSPASKSSSEKAKFFLSDDKTSSSIKNQADLDLAKIEGDVDLESESMTSVMTPADFGVRHHYYKENIPWSAGTVKKTKEDIEGKVKGDSRSADTDSKFENISDSDVRSSDGTTSDIIDGRIEIVVSGENQLQNLVHTIDGATETETDVDKVEEEKSKETSSRPLSVYDIEDIHLPAGIVRRTTQEIEEKNRMNDGSTENSNLSLHRSSSLKTDRDTPRKKRRNSERRKTITPILSPCSPSSCDTSPTKDISSHNFSFNDSVFHQTTCSQQRDEEKIDSEQILTEQERPDSNQDKNETKDSEKQSLEEPNKAVYKFLGEEVSLEKGIVKKQKMGSKFGIELMNRERQLSDQDIVGRSQKSSESDAASSDPATPTETKMFKKEKTLESSTSVFTVEKQSVSQNPERTPGKDNSSGTPGKDNSSETNDHSSDLVKDIGIEEHIPEFSVTKENFEKAIAKTKDEENFVTPPKISKKPQAGFDKETLELIREIGSAILNSPAKSEVEDYEEEEAQLGSGLVRHYVKNIEKSTKHAKKKKKEIIIIDKESQEKKHSWRWNSSTDQKKETSPGPPAKKTLSQSLSSPVHSSVKKESEIDMSPFSKSPPLKGGVISKSPPKKNSTSDCLDKHLVVETEKEMEEDLPGVKLLVGRYEGCQPTGISYCKSASLSEGQQPSGISHGKSASLSEGQQPSGISHGKSTSLSEECKPSGVNRGKTASLSEECKSSSVSRGKTASLSDIKEVNSSECLSLEQSEGGNNLTENDSADKLSDSEESMSEDSAMLRQLRNQLKKTSDHTRRPKSVELVRRNSAGINCCSEENQSSIYLEGRKVRKLQGKTHPLTKLEYRKKFYNTM